MAEWTKVAEVAELLPDEGRVVEAGGKSLALFRVGESVYAIDNTCGHRGGPLGEGELEGTIVTCPWHGWRWDVATGANAQNPSLTQACYRVKVEDGSVFVEA